MFRVSAGTICCKSRDISKTRIVAILRLDALFTLPAHVRMVKATRSSMHKRANSIELIASARNPTIETSPDEQTRLA